MKSHSKRVSVRCLLVALVLLTISAGAMAQNFQAKVWFVNPSQGEPVAFPAPSAQEDIDFATNGIAYIGQGQASGPEYCVTIGSFLSTCGTPTVPAGVTAGLHFTGYLNPNLGGHVATAGTLINKTKYATIIEFTGTVNLTNGQQIQILHDDGVALMIDGTLISGFSGGVTFPVIQSVTFTGTTGPHSIDLLYCNLAFERGDGAWLLFFPQLF
jgi:hypothetical protein